MNSRSIPIASDLFERNRLKLRRQMGAGSWAIASANPRMHRNGDVHFPYRQDSDFFYLSGINQEGCTLFLSREEEVLFLPEDDSRNQLWNGQMLQAEEARALSGIENVRPLGDLDAFLGRVLDECRDLIMDTPAEWASENGFRINGGMMRRKVKVLQPGLESRSLSSMLSVLRMVKETEEVEAIRKACSITGQAFQRVMHCLAPGVPEYGLEAEITAAFISSGSTGHAFEPIVASGKNALILHYVDNNSICRDGDLVLLDFGAEWNNFASDCSRTLPVGGRFGTRQLELYKSVLQVFRQARSMMVPGVILGDFHRQVGALWEEEHVKLGLYSLREARMAGVDNPLWRKYYMHGTSHSMGLDVHDPFERERALEPGMVLTCEPGIYIPEEGIGIRLENDILISEKGPLDLMEDIPMDPEEIETIMNQK